jgi:hypothetical protein
MGSWILLAVLGLHPAYMGNYQTEQACQQAIFSIYLAQMGQPGHYEDPLILKAVRDVVKIQREYRCVPNG